MGASTLYPEFHIVTPDLLRVQHVVPPGVLPLFPTSQWIPPPASVLSQSRPVSFCSSCAPTTPIHCISHYNLDPALALYLPVSRNSYFKHPLFFSLLPSPGRTLLLLLASQEDYFYVSSSPVPTRTRVAHQFFTSGLHLPCYPSRAVDGEFELIPRRSINTTELSLTTIAVDRRSYLF